MFSYFFVYIHVELAELMVHSGSSLVHASCIVMHVGSIQKILFPGPNLTRPDQTRPVSHAVMLKGMLIKWGILSLIKRAIQLIINHSHSIAITLSAIGLTLWSEVTWFHLIYRLSQKITYIYIGSVPTDCISLD